MKHNVGDRVRINSLKWYEAHRDVEGHVYNPDGIYIFTAEMTEFCGLSATITERVLDYYVLSVDRGTYGWEEWMFEDEFEIIETDEDGKVEVKIPEGFEYLIEDGKLYFKKLLEKKKHTYTEEEKELIAQKVYDFLVNHNCFGGEHFAQDDTSQIDSIDLMCELADIKDVTKDAADE